jgi:tetratricopeptide (TPR) repeat protein
MSDEPGNGDGPLPPIDTIPDGIEPTVRRQLSDEEQQDISDTAEEIEAPEEEPTGEEERSEEARRTLDEGVEKLPRKELLELVCHVPLDERSDQGAEEDGPTLTGDLPAGVSQPLDEGLTEEVRHTVEDDGPTHSDGMPPTVRSPDDEDLAEEVRRTLDEVVSVSEQARQTMDEAPLRPTSTQSIVEAQIIEVTTDDEQIIEVTTDKEALRPDETLVDKALAGRDTAPTEDPEEVAWEQRADDLQREIEREPEATIEREEADDLQPELEGEPEAGEAAWEQRLDDLQRTLEETSEDPRRVEILQEIAGIYLEHLEDREAARSCLEQVLELDPANDEAFEQLDRIYQHTEATERLIELLVDRTDHVETVAQGRLLHRVARLYEQLDQPDKALIVLEAAANAAPEVTGVVRDLERLKPKPVPDDPMERLEHQLAEAPSDAKRIEIYEKMAALWQQRERIDRAIESLRHVLTLDHRRDSCYRKLEQLLHQEGRFEDLAALLRQHIEVSAASERVELGLRLAKILEGPLEDPRGAIEVYNGVVSIEKDNSPALQALVRLNEDIADWPQVVEAQRKLTQCANEQMRIDLLYRMGCIYTDRLGDLEQAEACFYDLVQEAPDHVKGAAQLAYIYRGRGDWGKAVRLLLQAEEASSSPPEKARLLYEAGIARLEGMDDEEGAAELLSRTLAVDPDHAQAAEPLSEIYYKQGRFEDLGPVIDVMLRKVDPEDTQRLPGLFHKAAVVAAATEKPDRAAKYFQKAYDLDPAHLPTLQGLAGLTLRREEWTEARRWLQELVEQGGRLEPGDLVDALFNLATCARHLDDKQASAKAYQRALSIDPEHQPSLEALAELQAGAGDWQAVLAAKLALLESAEGDKRVELYQEVGEIQWRQLGRTDEAITAYRKALDLKPESHVALHQLIELFSATDQWAGTVEMCDRMAQIEKEPKLRAKYYMTAGVAARDKLQDPSRALEYLNKVLDNDLEQLKAFESIDQICTKRRDWKQLQQNYVRMIKRLPEEGYRELKLMLWHNLGEVLRTRRRDFESAIAAFEAAARLEPDNLERRKILAELYLNSGTKYAKQAISAHHDLILRSPHEFGLYRALRRIYMESGQYDCAWCLCEALSLMQQADAEELGFYKQYRRGHIRRAAAPINDELWQRFVHHPEQEPMINTIFALVTPVVASMTVRPAAHYGLKTKDRCDPSSDLPLVQMFYYATSVLNVTKAALYLDPGKPAGLLMAHTPDTPSFMAGSHILHERSEKELAFTIARQLTFLRPEHFLRNALPSRAQLQAVLFGVLRFFMPELELPPEHSQATKQIVDRLKQHLNLGQREQLELLVRRFSPKHISKLDRWWTSLDLTADRLGLLLCNDLEVAAAIINAEPSASEVAPADRIAQLAAYSTSEAYMKAREKLKITIAG